MKDWGPLGVVIDLALAVAALFAVLCLVGVFWLAIQALLPLWPLPELLAAGAVYLYWARKGG